MTGIVIYFFFSPESPWFPTCPVYKLTGWLCPGCGSQRAIHALLHGDISAAWNYNAMMLILAPTAIVAILIELNSNRFPRIHRALVSPTFILTILATILLWAIARNL